MDTTSNIALFIDFENFGHQPDHSEKSIKTLLDQLKGRGRLIYKRAYADWQRFPKARNALHNQAIDLIEMPSQGREGKNSADIRLVVDAMEIAMQRSHIDTFVIVSGDSDYRPLIAKLREWDRYVIAIGLRASTSPTLKNYCDEVLTFVPDLVTTNSSVSEAPSVPPSRRATITRDVRSLLERAVTSLQDQGVETIGSRVKSQMLRLDASFHEGRSGVAGFRNFLQLAESENLVTLRDGSNGELIVQLASSQPKSILPADEKGPELPIQQMTLLALALDGLRDPIDSGTIGQLWRMLDHDFSLEKYALPREGAVRKVFDVMRELGWIKVRQDSERNQYMAEVTDKGLGWLRRTSLDDTFHQARYRHLIERQRLPSCLDDLHTFWKALVSILTENPSEKSTGLDTNQLESLVVKKLGKNPDTARTWVRSRLNLFEECRVLSFETDDNDSRGVYRIQPNWTTARDELVHTLASIIEQNLDSELDEDFSPTRFVQVLLRVPVDESLSEGLEYFFL